jgi:hypothetical protein
MNTCEDCRECLARSRKRQRGEFEDQHITGHNESTTGFEDRTLSSNEVLRYQIGNAWPLLSDEVRNVCSFGPAKEKA